MAVSKIKAFEDADPYKTQQDSIAAIVADLVAELPGWGFPNADDVMDARYGAQVAIECSGLTPVSIYRPSDQSSDDPREWQVGYGMYESFEVQVSLFGLAKIFAEFEGDGGQSLVPVLRRLADEIEEGNFQAVRESGQ